MNHIASPAATASESAAQGRSLGREVENSATAAR